MDPDRDLREKALRCMRLLKPESVELLKQFCASTGNVRDDGDGISYRPKSVNDVAPVGVYAMMEVVATNSGQELLQYWSLFCGFTTDLASYQELQMDVQRVLHMVNQESTVHEVNPHLLQHRLLHLADPEDIGIDQALSDLGGLGVANFMVASEAARVYVEICDCPTLCGSGSFEDGTVQRFPDVGRFGRQVQLSLAGRSFEDGTVQRFPDVGRFGRQVQLSLAGREHQKNDKIEKRKKELEESKKKKKPKVIAKPKGSVQQQCAVSSDLNTDERQMVFSYSKFIPHHRLDNFNVEDLAKKVCKRFESHTGTMLHPNEIDLHVHVPGSLNPLHELTALDGSLLNVLQSKFPNWQRRDPQGEDPRHPPAFVMRMRCFPHD
eukprot:s612_g1.t1